jgi:hypothetical protein
VVTLNLTEDREMDEALRDVVSRSAIERFA